MPPIGFGVYKLSEDDLERVIPEALKLGYRYFDTAIRYKNQAKLVTLLKFHLKDQGIKRSDIYLVTKIGHRCLGNLPKRCKKMAHIDPHNYDQADLKLDLESDWKRVQKEVCSQIEYVDMILLHRPYYSKINSNIWKELQKLQQIFPNEIKQIGVSNFRMADLDDLHPKPNYNQIEISPFAERIVLREYCRRHNIITIGHSSLAKMLTPHDAPKFKDFPELDQLAKKYKTTRAVIMLKWSYDQSIQIIPRTSDLDHLKENYSVESLSWKLTSDDYKLLKNKVFFLTHNDYRDDSDPQ